MSFKIVAGHNNCVLEYGGENSTLEDMIEKAKAFAKRYELDDVKVQETRDVFSTKKKKPLTFARWESNVRFLDDTVQIYTSTGENDEVLSAFSNRGDVWKIGDTI